MDLRYKKLDERAVVPFKKYAVDAGFDLTAIWMEDTPKFTVYGTGLAFEIPPGFVGLMFPRSSVTNQDYMLKNAVGVIDASYRGEIMCRFFKAHHDMVVEDRSPKEDWSGEDYVFIDFAPAHREPDYYKIGDRVCQVVFMELPYVNLIEAEELSDTERGTAGYGSSGA